MEGVVQVVLGSGRAEAELGAELWDVLGPAAERQSPVAGLPPPLAPRVEAERAISTGRHADGAAAVDHSEGSDDGGCRPVAGEGRKWQRLPLVGALIEVEDLQARGSRVLLLRRRRQWR